MKEAEAEFFIHVIVPDEICESWEAAEKKATELNELLEGCGIDLKAVQAFRIK